MKMPQKRMYHSEDSDESDFTPPKQKRVKQTKDNDGEEYLERRERNNIAVRKSREKSRAKAKETMQQVKLLRDENEVLEQKVQLLSKELSVLKDLFLAHAGSVSDTPRPSPPPVVAIQVTATDHQYSAMKPEN